MARISFRSIGGSCNEIACDFQEFPRIRQIVHHEVRERLRSIQRDVSSLFNSVFNIHAVCLQS